jgi:hypothetical protein
MGWGAGLVFAGVLFVAVIAIALWVGVTLRNPVIPYQKINQCKPGAFSVGKDVRDV